MRHFKRQPLSLVDVCDDECGLCATLGCLRPEPVDGDTLRRELDAISLTGAREVVFPPNAILHHDLDSIVRDVRGRGLLPIVRVRPSRLASLAETIATLEFRGARFEIVVDRPVTEVDLARMEEISAALEGVTIVLNRSIDAEAVVEALSDELRSKVALLAPVESGERFHPPDVIYRLVDRPSLAHLPSAGLMPHGSSRFLETGIRARVLADTLSGDGPRVRLSVVIPLREGSPLRLLDSLRNQSHAKDEFEIHVVADRANPRILTDVETWMNANEGLSVQLLALDGFGVSSREFRAGVARNTGAFRSRGDLLLFLDADSIAPVDLVRETIDSHERADVVQFKRFDRSHELEEYWQKFQSTTDWSAIAEGWKYVSSFALSVKTRHFLEVGGFPSALNRYGCEDTFLGWKLSRLNLRFALGESSVEHVGPAPRRIHSRTKMNRIAASARAFYLSTLDPKVYRIFFPVMGPWSDARWALRALAGAVT